MNCKIEITGFLHVFYPYNSGLALSSVSDNNYQTLWPDIEVSANNIFFFQNHWMKISDLIESNLLTSKKKFWIELIYAFDFVKILKILKY